MLLLCRVPPPQAPHLLPHPIKDPINQLLNPQAWEWQSSLESVWCREPPGLVPGLLDSGLNSARSLLWVLVCLASLNTDFFSLSGWGR